MSTFENDKVIKLKTAVDTNILVIGAGVSGLTTAICLREAGFKVTIVAEHFAPGLTSNVAGALWEWPPAVCGKHGTPRSLRRSKHWCMVSYEKFKQIQAKYGSEDTGVYLRDVYFYFKYMVEERALDLQKMNEIKDHVDGFERGLDIVRDSIDLGFQGGIVDAYKHMAPMADTDQYMEWLLKTVEDLGCEIIQEKLTGNVLADEQQLLTRYNAKAIVNCAGLGSIGTTGDSSMYPLRGALVRVKNQGGVIDAAHCISHDESSSDEQDIIFIVPRGKENIVILGGLAQTDQWATDLSLDIPIIRQMYNGCLDFLEELRELPVDSRMPVITGLRPFTQKNVCVERVPDSRVFYNYGHGGAGVTLSWGCATEIVERIQGMLQQNVEKQTFAGQSLDSHKQSVFILQHMLPMKADLAHIDKTDRNMVLLCSRQGLTKIVPSQYEFYNLVKIVEPYTLENLLSAYQEIRTTFTLTKRQSYIATNDEYSVFIAAQMRAQLDIEGEKPERVLPFTNKHALKKALENTTIRCPKFLIFDAKAYQEATDRYLAMVINTLGDAIFIKPSFGAGSEKTQRIYNAHQLKAWCDTHLDTDEEFEFNEFITGQLYNTSVIFKDGELSYFAACRHYRPNDEFLYGKPIGNIIVPEQDLVFAKLKQFSLEVLASLKAGHPKTGVFNIDFFIQQDNQPVLMEIAARPPGGLVSKMLYAYQGIRLQENALALQMGDMPSFETSARLYWQYSAYVVYPKRAGQVTSIDKPELDSEMQISWHIGVGQELNAATSIRDTAISILLQSNNLAELQADYEKLLSTDLYHCECPADYDVHFKEYGVLT